eukprot:CAMPEP_0204843470 /NCGR_PEP_ID=MMETSP1346-20131115/47996_1 /ASSEMBLY_ACC=CAM_ASM_000771 /TAXON_ID=215587 /ORGANISM="Aplanochytrium stocchinoi, Strain GSBS06" /LENGTH=440 /DNA_ID=CAMNT_0051982617 /DNA_START=392 /DNA_END=1714 /DNA_ORIENTATION=+
MDKLIETQLKVLKQNELTLQKLRAQQGTVRVPKCFCDRPVGERKHCEKVCRRTEWLKHLGVPVEREGVKNPRSLDIRIAKVHFPSESFISTSEAELGKSHLKDSIVGGRGSKDDPANVPKPSQNLDEVGEKLKFQERKIGRCVRETKIKEETEFMTVNALKPWESWKLTERLADAQEAALNVEKQLAETDDANLVLDDDDLDKYYDLRDELTKLEKARNQKIEEMNAEIKEKRLAQNLDEVGEKLKFQERKIGRCVRETKIKEETEFMTVNALKPWESWKLTERLADAQEAALNVEKQLAETDDANLVLDDDDLDKYYDLRDELTKLEKARNQKIEEMNAEIKEKRLAIGTLLKPTGKKRYLADVLHKPQSKKRKRPGQLDARHSAKKAIELAQSVSKLNTALEGVSSSFAENGMWWISDGPKPEIDRIGGESMVESMVE